jgi:hypothetical protein
MTEGDVTIRTGADSPTKTTADVVECELLAKPCVHELPVYRIGRERWHQVAMVYGHPRLEPCRATQLRLSVKA